MSEIRVNKITNRSGLGTITVSNAGAVFGGEKTGFGTDNPRYTLEVGAVGAGGTQLWVNGDARVTGIMSIGQGTITLDPDSNMIKLGALTMHRDSVTGDALLMSTNGDYNPFRASKFLIDATEVIDNNRNFTGVDANFSGNVSVGGTLTYEDVTNIDSVGLITARNGLHVTGGSVGIGTDNPRSKLHITGNASNAAALSDTVTDYALKFDSAITSNYFSNAICFAEGNNVNASIASFDGGSGGAQGLVFGTGPSNTERLRITSDGALNIGKGDESDNSANLVEVYVGATNESYATIRGKYNRTNEFNRSEVRFGVQDNGNGRGFLAFATGTNSAIERLRITSDGDVGIGTDNPGSKLEVNNESAVTVATFNSYAAAGPLISIERNGTAIGYLGSGENLVASTGSKDALSIRSQAEFSVATGGATERLRIDSSGKVGIGIISPGAQLDVFGTARIGGTVASGRRADFDTNGRLTLAYGDNNNVSNLILQNLATDATINHGSNIQWQFATNASSTAINAARINVIKEQQWTSTASTQDSALTITLAQNGSLGEKLRITSSGHVGIDQTNPNNMLDIGGVGTNGLSVRMGGSGYSTLFRYGTNEDNYISQGPSGQTIFRDRENDEHVRIDSAGRMGLNCPGQDLSAFNANGSQDLVIFSRGSTGLSAHAGITLHGGSTTASQCSLTFADGNAGAQRYAGSIDYLHSVDALSFRVASTGAMRIDSAHRLMMGTTTAVHTYRKIQIVGSYSGTSQRQGALFRYGEASSNGPVLTFEKNRSNSGGTTSTQTADAIGEIQFQGTDQGGSYRIGSMIRGEVAATPAGNRVPGMLRFYCDSGSTLNETMRLTRYGRAQVSKEFAIRNSAGYGNARNSRVEYIQGGNGTYSTCTVTIDQNSYGSTVYDIKVHGYSSSTAHVAGGYYQNGGIYNDSKSINHATSGVSVSGPTAAGGQTATFVFSRTNGWVHPICSISISTGGDGYIDESDITIVWS